MMLIEQTTPAVVYGDGGEVYVHAATGNVHYATGAPLAGTDRRILVVQLPDGVRPGERVDVLDCGYFHGPASGNGAVLYEPTVLGMGSDAEDFDPIDCGECDGVGVHALSCRWHPQWERVA
jgi:hypothetical protein